MSLINHKRREYQVVQTMSLLVLMQKFL